MSEFEILVKQDLDATALQFRETLVSVTADTLANAISRVEQLLKEDVELEQLDADWEFGRLEEFTGYEVARSTVEAGRRFVDDRYLVREEFRDPPGCHRPAHSIPPSIYGGGIIFWAWQKSSGPRVGLVVISFSVMRRTSRRTQETKDTTMYTLRTLGRRIFELTEDGRHNPDLPIMFH